MKLKAARVFRKTGRELSKRSFTQMGQIGIALRNFIDKGETAHVYYVHETHQSFGIVVEKTKDNLLKIRFDAGGQRYYRIYGQIFRDIYKPYFN